MNKNKSYQLTEQDIIRTIPADEALGLLSESSSPYSTRTYVPTQLSVENALGIMPSVDDVIQQEADASMRSLLNGTAYGQPDANLLRLLHDSPYQRNDLITQAMFGLPMPVDDESIDVVLDFDDGQSRSYGLDTAPRMSVPMAAFDKKGLMEKRYFEIALAPVYQMLEERIDEISKGIY